MLIVCHERLSPPEIILIVRGIEAFGNGQVHMHAPVSHKTRYGTRFKAFAALIRRARSERKSSSSQSACLCGARSPRKTISLLVGLCTLERAAARAEKAAQRDPVARARGDDRLFWRASRVLFSLSHELEDMERRANARQASP